MSRSPTPPASTDDLQFTTVEPAVTDGATSAPTPQACLGCHRPIVSSYFALAGKVLCPACCARVQAPLPGSRAARVAKAFLLGLGAGLVGAAVWFAIRRLAHLEIGLVAVVVGFMVGKAVRKGSGGRGGRGYQVMAVVLTYCCIAANYMPDVFEAMVSGSGTRNSTTAAHRGTSGANTAKSSPANESGSPGSASDPASRPPVEGPKAILAAGLVLVLVFGLSLAAPFLAGAQNIIGLLIIGFALWEAWKLSGRRTLPITGPYSIAQPQSGPGLTEGLAPPDSAVII